MQSYYKILLYLYTLNWRHFNAIFLQFYLSHCILRPLFVFSAFYSFVFFSSKLLFPLHGLKHSAWNHLPYFMDTCIFLFYLNSKLDLWWVMVFTWKLSLHSSDTGHPIFSRSFWAVTGNLANCGVVFHVGIELLCTDYSLCLMS